MSESPQNTLHDPSTQALVARLGDLGQSLGEREVLHCEGLATAQRHIEELRSRVESALEAFHGAVSRAGAPHLKVVLGRVRTDAKHLRSLEFELLRGRYKAVVTAKSRGEMTLVGPFHAGKTEGPCLSYSFDAGNEFDEALASFLEKFLEEAATP